MKECPPIARLKGLKADMSGHKWINRWASPWVPWKIPFARGMSAVSDRTERGLLRAVVVHFGFVRAHIPDAPQRGHDAGVGQ
jgi:hypothetical protein